MKPFIEVGGQIVAVAHIVAIVPPSKERSKGAIRLTNGNSIAITEKDWVKLERLFVGASEGPLA